MKTNFIIATFFALVTAALCAFAQHSIPSQSRFFVANEGQWDEPFAFKLSAGNTTYYITESGLTIDIRQTMNEERGTMNHRPDESDFHPSSLIPHPSSVRGHVLKMNFVNGNPHPEIVGEDKLASYSNYFIGRDSCKWRSRVGHYQRVIARNVWNGIDVEFVADAQGIKTNYHVQPYADPSQIVIEYEGLDAPLRIDGSGNLVLRTSLGDLKEQKPWSWQKVNSVQTDVASRLHTLNETTYAVMPGSYLANKELTIDPTIYSSYFGAEGEDNVVKILADTDGRPVLCGNTTSSNFPITPGSYRDSVFAPSCGFVSKLDANGIQLVYSTFVTGYATEDVNDAEIGNDGSIYVVGDISQGAAPPYYPLTPNAVDTIYSGEWEGFLFRLSADADSLLFCSYIGGNDLDIVEGVGVDELGRVYLCGQTASPDFPTTPGALFPNFGGHNPFFTIIDVQLGTILYSTFFSSSAGNNDGSAREIEVEDPGVVWLTGTVNNGNVPITPDAIQPIFYGYGDFFARLNLNTNTIEYCSYVPGTNRGFISHLVSHDSTRITMSGSTRATDFPITPSAFDSVGPFSFLLSMSIPNSIIRSTYTNRMTASDFYVSSNGYVAMSGPGWSGFPVTTDAVDSMVTGDRPDGILAVIDDQFSTIRYASFLGGDSTESFLTMANADDGVFWTAGRTFSMNYPTTPDAIQPVCYPGTGDYGDGCIAKWDLSDILSASSPIPPLPTNVAFAIFPNPVNGQVSLQYFLPRFGQVEIGIYDITGRLVTKLLPGIQQAGPHVITYNATALPSAVYFTRLIAPGIDRTQKLIVTR